MNEYESTPIEEEQQQQAALAMKNETSAIASATQAKAMVEARYIAAERHPRNIAKVRTDLLAACKRPRFAEGAKYAKPVGGRNKAVGPSIRFMEEAARCMKNIYVETTAIYEDDEKRIIRVTVTDLESNITYPTDVTIEKFVERLSFEGKEVIGKRLNSSGKWTYKVRATDDDMLNKQNALISKAIRNGVARVVPSDIIEDAMDQVDKTLRDRDAKDPEEQSKKLIDAFAGLKVDPDDLHEYLGHAPSKCSPAELTELRGVYTAIKEGETTWVSVMEDKTGKKKKGEKPDFDASKVGASDNDEQSDDLLGNKEE